MTLDDEFEQKGHEVGKISFNIEATRSTICLYGLADRDEIAALLSIEERVRIIFDYVTKFEFLFVLMLAALFQLLQFFYVDVFSYCRHLASQEDPSAC